MVMEAATLSGPHRKCTVVPVQKSLSLPSYARAGGEGIDHRLIFAALEQKERVRRKSRIFAPRKEKCDRPTHLFCLPIPTSGAKCRETSLSSDTSCSSLEYKKSSPVLSKKETASKSRKEDTSNSEKEDTIKTQKEHPQQEAAAYETANTIKSESKTTVNPSRSYKDAPGWETNQSLTYVGINASQKVSENRKGHCSPMGTLRLAVCSSDSMERSSRSSSDSLSRKERMIALKARVEAAREKYGNTSSSEEEAESRLAITRYNSDDVIHRSVRDVKSRSYLREKRLRRRSQDEFSIKKTQRKQNLSLSINPEGDGIRLDLEKASKPQFSNNHMDIKTDFCPSPNFPDILKKNYFSDFPSKENAMHFVQARIRHIEDEERKRRSGSDFQERFGIQNMHSHENPSPVSTELRRPSEKLNESSGSMSEIKTSNFDFSMRSSPIPRSSQAPTPPPRSPKSMTFINKALIQHQNSMILNQENSLERKKLFFSNVPAVSYSQIFENFDSKNDSASGDKKSSVTASPNTTSEKQKIKELFSSRRKTCGNFDFVDSNILDELCSIGSPVCSSTSNLVANKKFASAMQIKQIDNKGYFSNTETPGLPSEEDARNKMWKSKWQENEQRKEYMFNSLESRKKSNPPSWTKWRAPPSKTETCYCNLFPDNKFSCPCRNKFDSKQMHSSTSDASKLETLGLIDPKGASSLPITHSTDRLASDTNVTSKDLSLKTGDQSLKSVNRVRENISNGESILKHQKTEKLSAAANLDSAMEELENVYRSLKMSSDNLSDRNSVSNVSLSDDDVKFPKPKNKNIFEVNDSRFQRRSSVCETGLDSRKNFNYHKPTICHPLKHAVPLPNDTNSEINQCSIDELFNDLTQQLDLEQKLLKEPKDNRNQQPKLFLPTNRFDSPKRSNKPLPQVSIHKEFYENLCKNSRDQSIKNHSSRICENGTSHSVEPTNKKRQKAVRSLSENLSHLMSTADLESKNKKHVDHTNDKTTPTDQPLPKCYERILPDSIIKHESKRDININQSNLSPKSEQKSHNIKRDEIRHIRVSMDTNILQPNLITSSSSFSDTKQYSSLSSAVSGTQSSNKSETPKSCFPEQNCESKEHLDVLDETGLEKLLNSLLGEVPERQSSLSQTKDLGPATPPPIVPGKHQNVTTNRSSVLQKMDAYIASKGKSKPQAAESYLKSVKSEDHAQKVNFCQNDNSLSQPSFIPVYTKKTDMCHNFSKNAAEDKNKLQPVESSETVKTLNSLLSPSPRQKCLTDQIPGMAWNSHLRRRSVGFEDVASLSHNYGFSLANKRMQSETINCNISAESALRPNNQLNSENDKYISYGKENDSERGFISTINQNSQVTQNENNGFLQDTKPSQQFKDKSSKRKSSLNRMDFLDFSMACIGNDGRPKTSYQQKNSSSDEGNDKSKSEFLSSKRKHVSLNQSLSKDANKSTNEVPPQSSSREFKNGAHLLPRALQNHHMKSRHHRRVQSAATHLHKFSHSAGELESLTDPSEAAALSSKICLSAQELDPSDCSGKYSKNTKSSVKKHSPGVVKSVLSSVTVSKNENASHSNVLSHVPENNCRLVEINSKDNSIGECPAVQQACGKDFAHEDRPVLSSLELNGALNLKHIDSKSEDDAEVIESTACMKNLDISSEVNFDNEIYISADDNCDHSESDTERRPNSILRKKVSEEKKELHSILKPSSDEKQSKTPPPSILKHRESSEEKDMWQQGDLHSILKKSTSEDESCNSGPDIRPILKVSTDDESPTCSMLRPRPILKKRTSFSEECSYASYPNGELKPILKKKSPLASDDQPRPILKSRRKSEDVRSTTSEFVLSRPRAYSADMGVKPNLETRFDLQESNKDDAGKQEDNDL